MSIASRTLILGGIRSGKSRLAEQLAHTSGLPVTYVATAHAGDSEMAQRIAAHRSQRPTHWTVCEEPLALAATLHAMARPEHLVLVDCLTLWLTNLLLHTDDQRLPQEQSALLDLLPHLPGHLIMVGNETGLGIVPLGELTRRFCDASGLLHQALAQRCDSVILTIAGLPTYLKGHP
ncbi:MAG: bifunctional adenosylcobinamide kinase/adenosylcobinamide-phosphate guanylyltransferase [Ferrovum sp.]|nr:bifunctional adenosylcobinamide kinase/adenosylcobinamide-phosphate guanylyltransferase [Ferrovum sp.]NDU88011.1 bifunctional adenosylcobinamide kinase/adenosylcobinamide-phosphate guanylyltransferase [Ferrovum sp.]